MKRILVTGSRDWPDHLAVWGTLDGVMEEFDLNCEPDEYGNTLPDPMKVVIVHGGCPTGADLFADDWCNNQLILPEVYKADWKRLGNRRAGPIRNQMMVDTLVPGKDLCLAFILNASVGATHTLHMAKKAGIETRVHAMWTPLEEK